MQIQESLSGEVQLLGTCGKEEKSLPPSMDSILTPRFSHVSLKVI